MPAEGSYKLPDHDRSGFGVLKVKTSPEFPDVVQMQAAGFIEGYLTAGQTGVLLMSIAGMLSVQCTFPLTTHVTHEDMTLLGQSP